LGEKMGGGEGVGIVCTTPIFCKEILAPNSSRITL